jgi:Tfp pilus assembly protein PilZ
MWNGINRREFPRAEYPCKITIKRRDSNDVLSSYTENIGVGGIGVILPNDFGIFAPVDIELDLLDKRPVVECAGTIMWIVEKKGEADAFDTGIEFTNLKKEDVGRISDIVEKMLTGSI